MALDFPANPTNGQVYDAYVYNSTVGAWQAREDSKTVAVLSATVPASANPGDIWINTNDGIAFVYYDDGTSAQWIELLPSGVPLLNTKADLSGATFTGNVTVPRLTSTQATGTAPLTISSTTIVTNLNADLLDGQHASAFSPVAGSSSITTVGTVTSGTWNGSAIQVANGGTGTNSLTGYPFGTGTSALVARNGYLYMQTLYFTSAGTSNFTKATYPWLRGIRVSLVGGGGGGGATVAPAASTNAAGNGGGGGCYAERWITDINGLASSVTVTVGAGGTGGSAATNNAGAGGTSSFGTLCSGNGGSPGLIGNQTSTFGCTIPNNSFTSMGGSTGVGDFIIPGSMGGIGFMQGGNSNAMGGYGGASVFGSTIAVPGYPGSGEFRRNGLAGQNYGSGGSGGASLQSAGSTTGGAGAPGIVIVELYA